MNNTSTILSVVATVKNRLPDIGIQNGQLIFVHDSQTIALDYNGKRKFYNQIVELATDQQRKDMLAPIIGTFYFVMDTATLWCFQQNGWIQITYPPKEIIFIGAVLPTLGSANKLYVDTTENNIKIWDTNKLQFQIVSDKTCEISEEEISSLFSI